MNGTFPSDRVTIRSEKCWDEFRVLGQLGDYLFLSPAWQYLNPPHPEVHAIVVPEGLRAALRLPETIYRVYRPTLDYLIEDGDAAWQREPMPRPRWLRFCHWLEDRVYWWVTLPSRVLHGVTRHLP